MTDLDSDHLPVIVNFHQNLTASPLLPRLINGRIDWELYKMELDNRLQVPTLYTGTEDIDKAVHDLTTAITDSIMSATAKINHDPRLRSYQSRTPLYIRAKIAEKNWARRQWHQSRNPEFKTQYNRLSREIRQDLERERIEDYRSYLSEMKSGDSTMWKETRRILKTSSPIPPLKRGNSLLASDQEKAEVFAEFLNQRFTSSPLDLDQEAQIESNYHPPTSLGIPPSCFIAMSDIEEATHHLPLRKAPGDDLIPAEVLKKLTKKGMAYVLSVFNACLRWGYFPTAWKNAILICFHKHGKPKNEASSYRPISLLPILSKMFERIVYKRILDFCDANNIIPNHQFGFRPRHSAVHQLQRVTEAIVRGFEGRKYTAAVFLDVEAAFDSVWHKGLLYKLQLIGLPDYLRKIVASFLTDRSFQVRVNNILSGKRWISAGVPQGAILSPLLFNIFCHDLPELLDLLLATYADDTLLMSQDHNVLRAKELLQEGLDLLASWFTTWRLRLNPRKTEAKVFTLRRLNVEELPTLTLENEGIPWKRKDETVRYLGLHLDTKLTWSSHVNTKLSQGYARLQQLYPMLNRRSPLRPECGRLLYTGLLRPLVLFGCPVWCALGKTQLEKLQRFQNKVLRLATGAPWFVRNSQIQKEMQVPEIKVFIQNMSENFKNNLTRIPTAAHYRIGEETRHRRLKPRLLQDIH